MEKKVVRGDMELPPLRSLDDFLLESARFQIPNIKDFDKWGNRVVHNLLYYQTNYFFAFIIIFLIIGFMHPGKMIIGMLSMIVVCFVFAYVSTEGRAIHNFKKQYPLCGILFVCSAVCFLTYTLGSLLIFMVGILFPFSAIFVHASLRLRSIKNRVVNKIEGLGLKRTPMGALLDQFEDITSMTINPKSSFVQKLNN